LENRVCANFSPNDVVGVAIWWDFDNKPIALEHLNWYLSTGAGADFDENSNIEVMLRTDTGVQSRLAQQFPSGQTSGRYSNHLTLMQSDYTIQDFRYSFGTIDRFDFEIDFDAKTLHGWFQDRYEWHPYYSFYNQFPDDVWRETNCVHAALVELKSGGVAKDYWMKGEATVPINLFKPDSGGSGEGDF
jgi:hypothetical protein